MSDAPKAPDGDEDDEVVVAEVEVTDVEVAGGPAGGIPGLGDLGGLADGLGGGLGGLEGLLESAQEALSAQAAAAEEVIEGTAGGGVVVARMSGAGEVLSLTISPDVVDPDDVEMLQDLVVAALHDAAGKVTALQRQALGAFGGMDLCCLDGSAAT